MAAPIASPNFLCPQTLPSSYKPHAPPLLPVAPPLNCRSKAPVLVFGPRRGRKSRGISVVTRAGSSSYIFAFVFPITMLAITVVASIRVADKLDQQYLEELAIEQSILETEEDDDGNAATSPKEEIEIPSKRNRPKREVEITST
nr:uncharacterized protein LOC109148092 [Ipomoea trifida]GMC82312.1 V-set and immunoglobulin domain-containing protein [Ipomoea batatas]